MSDSESKATIYRQRAVELRSLATQLTLPEARMDTLAEAAKWERLAKLVEKAEAPPKQRS